MRRLRVLMIFIPSILALLHVNAHAGAQVEIAGGYSYSNLQYTPSSGTSFSMLSNAGSFFEVEGGIGTKSFELFANYRLSQDNYVPPSSRTLENAKINRGDLSGGLRLMVPNFAWYVKYLKRDAVVMEGLGNNQYRLSGVSPTLMVSGLQFSAREKLLAIIINIEGGFPLDPAMQQLASSTQEIKYGQYMGATAKINIGNVWRVSLYGGVRNTTYEGDDKYNGFNIFAGLTLSSAFSFWNSRGKTNYDEVPYSYSGPRYSGRR